jgi:hypothetical protein
MAHAILLVKPDPNIALRRIAAVFCACVVCFVSYLYKSGQKYKKQGGLTLLPVVGTRLLLHAIVLVGKSHLQTKLPSPSILTPSNDDLKVPLGMTTTIDMVSKIEACISRSIARK